MSISFKFSHQELIFSSKPYFCCKYNSIIKDKLHFVCSFELNHKTIIETVAIVLYYLLQFGVISSVQSMNIHFHRKVVHLQQIPWWLVYGSNPNRTVTSKSFFWSGWWKFLSQIFGETNLLATLPLNFNQLE